MKDVFAKMVVSLGGVGFIKPASATWGSLAAAVLLYFTFPFLGLGVKFLLTLLVFLLGTWLASYLERVTKVHDPYFVVIDELVGMMIVTLFLGQVWWQFLVAFVLFRIFDIAKLWPASFFDKRPGGFSIMFDDVIMALPALGSLHIILYFLADV